MILLRGLAIWLVIILAESVHGIARRLLLEPLVGDLQARQISVFTGSAIILAIALLCIPWLQARTSFQLWAVGFLWLGLTVGFEIGLGHFVFSYSWERIGSDYNLRQGGLLPFGLLILLSSPLLAAKLRRSI